MAAVTSWYPCDQKFHSHKSSSYIDHLAISAPWLERVQRCAIAYNLTRRVRAVPSVAMLDHMIIVAELDYANLPGAPAG